MSDELTIVEVEVLILDGRVEYGTATADGEMSGPRHLCLVRVTTAGGLVGYGDVDSHPWIVKAIVEASTHIPEFCAGLREAVVGLNAWDREGVWERMYRHSWYHGRLGAAQHALSGIDMALWDLAGQSAGRPVADLLGGRRRDRVPAYASTLFRETPDEMRRAARGYLERGFRAIKFGWGLWGADRRRDRELLAAARREVGPDVALMVDGHMQGDLPSVVAALRGLEDLDPFWVEEPLPADRPAQLAALGRATPLRIATGEQLGGIQEFEELLREDGVSIVQPDLSRCGGFTAFSRIAQLATRRGRRVVPHAWTSHLLTAAALHANAWLPEAVFVEFNVSGTPLVRELVREAPALIDGCLEVPTGPGLGVDVDSTVIDRHRVA